MTEKVWELWSEGYVASGGVQTATFHGEFEGKTFEDAIQAFKNTLTDQRDIDCVHVKDKNFWGCQFFDNEDDARKSFG